MKMLVDALLAASIITVPTPVGTPSTDVTAHGGVVYQTQDAGDPTVGFLKIHNTGAADTLTAISCPIADITSLVDGNGKPVAQVPVPAKADVVLSAAGPHLALTGTHFSVQYGGIVPCSLTFTNNGVISVFLYAEAKPPG